MIKSIITRGQNTNRYTDANFNMYLVQSQKTYELLKEEEENDPLNDNYQQSIVVAKESYDKI